VPQPRHERRTNTLVLTGLLMETIAAIGPAMPAAVAAAAAAITEAEAEVEVEAATTTHAGSKDDDDDVHVRFSQILHTWEILAVTHLLHDDDDDDQQRGAAALPATSLRRVSRHAHRARHA
jgi:hypothetical protein